LVELKKEASALADAVLGGTMEQAKNWYYPPVRHDFFVGEGVKEHRHEELIDQGVCDVLVDAIKRGQTHRDAQRFTECRSLYELSCGNASWIPTIAGGCSRCLHGRRV